MTEKTTFIPARLKSSVVGGHVAGTSDIIDDTRGKTQDVINDEVEDAIENITEAIGDESSATSIKGRVKTLEDEMQTKQEKLEFDNMPADGSSNPVKSSGIKASLDTKVDKITGKGLSTEDYTAIDKQKLYSLPSSEALQEALDSKQPMLVFDNQPTDGSVNSVRSGAIKSYVDNETARAKASESTIDNKVVAVNAKIPNEASAQNQLADKAFVNSSIATETANYISNGGEPFNSVEELNNYSGTLTNNDYAFVKGTDASGNTVFKRYKYNASSSSWALEYELNNSSFTAAQWETINSGITGAMKDKLNALPSTDELNTMLGLKQDVISDLDNIRSNAQTGANAYQKPQTGIPSSDMSAAVQTSLNKADTALQEHQSLSDYYNKEQVDGKLAQKQDTLTIDSTPTVNSGNPISSDAVYDLQQAVNSALQNKQNLLTFDTTPTADSGNPVTSGGIFSAIMAHSSIQFVEVEVLPAPSPNTMGKIYLLKEGEAYQWWVTIEQVISDTTTYSWRQVSANSIDLSDYYTIEQIDALFRALATVASTGNFGDLNSVPDTLAGYGISDAKIEEGTITLGSETIVPLTEHQDISGKAEKAEMAVTPGTGQDADKATIQLKEGLSTTVLVQHQDISGKQDVLDFATNPECEIAAEELT